jgi:ubiquinone biosynthesis protein Coq4
VRLHDLNHVVTGYGTDWAGELEIAGFELGAGCGRHVMAWVINSGGVAAGLLRQPRKTLRAYARGRASKQSIYRLLPRWDERVLDEPVASMRETLGVPAEATPTARDLIGAASLGLLGIALHFGPVVAIAAGLFAAWRAYA